MLRLHLLSALICCVLLQEENDHEPEVEVTYVGHSPQTKHHLRLLMYRDEQKVINSYIYYHRALTSAHILVYVWS